MATSSFTPTGPTLAGPLTTDDRLVVEAGQALDVTGLVLVGAVSDAGSLSVPASSTLEVARSGATEQSIDLSGRMEVAGTVRVDNGQALVASQGELVLAGGYFGPPVMDAGSTIMVPSYAQNPSIKVEGLVHGYGVMGAGREFSRGPALYGTNSTCSRSGRLRRTAATLRAYNVSAAISTLARDSSRRERSGPGPNTPNSGQNTPPAFQMPSAA